MAQPEDAVQGGGDAVEAAGAAVSEPQEQQQQPQQQEPEPGQQQTPAQQEEAPAGTGGQDAPWQPDEFAKAGGEQEWQKEAGEEGGQDWQKEAASEAVKARAAELVANILAEPGQESWGGGGGGGANAQSKGWSAPRQEQSWGGGGDGSWGASSDWKDWKAAEQTSQDDPMDGAADSGAAAGQEAAAAVGEAQDTQQVAETNNEKGQEAAGGWGDEGKAWEKPAWSAPSWGGNQAQGDKNDYQNKSWSKWDDGNSGDRGWQKKSWSEWDNKKSDWDNKKSDWDNKKSDWDNKKSDWDSGKKSWHKREENESQSWWDKKEKWGDKNKSSWSDDWKDWRKDSSQENKPDWGQDWRQSSWREDEQPAAKEPAGGPSAREMARLLDVGDGPWGARKRSRSPHRVAPKAAATPKQPFVPKKGLAVAFVPKSWKQQQEAAEQDGPGGADAAAAAPPQEQKEEEKPADEAQPGQADEDMEEEEEVFEGAHPVMQFLPWDLRREVPLGTADNMVAHCASLREETWPDFNLIGGGPSGNPDLETVKTLSRKLQERVELKMRKPSEPPAPGADQTAIFARANHLSEESEAAIRALPETARLRVLRAGPIVGQNKDATAMARARKAVASLKAAERTDHNLKTFIMDNFLGSTSEKMIRAVSPEIQMMVMQKGPCLGPCPAQELFARIDAAEEKVKEEREKEAKRQAEEAERMAQGGAMEEEAPPSMPDAPPTLLPAASQPGGPLNEEAPPTLLPQFTPAPGGGLQTPMAPAMMGGMPTPMVGGQQTPMVPQMMGQQTPMVPQMMGGQQVPMSQQAMMWGGATPLVGHPQASMAAQEQSSRLAAMWDGQH